MSSSNVLLVIGDAQVGKRYLVRQLQGTAVASSSSSTSSSSVKSAHTDIESHTIPLDTKYYTAQVNVQLLPALHAPFAALTSDENEEEKEEEKESEKAKQAEASSTTLSPAAIAEFTSLAPQAIVLIFSLTRAETFYSLVNTWSTYLTQCGADVMLLVGNTQSTPIDQLTRDALDLEELAKEWSIEHQVEYVRMTHDQTLGGSARLVTPASASSSSSSPDDAELYASNEPIGLDRIKESLECNQWSDMTMKPRNAFGASKLRPSPPAQKPLLEEELDEDALEAQLRQNEEIEAEIFAKMQQEHAKHDTITTAADESEEKFEKFVSASNAAASQSTSSSSSSSSTSATASVPSTSSTSSTSTSKPTSTFAARSASASAFANAFASAIRVPDTKKPAATTKPASKPIVAASEEKKSTAITTNETTTATPSISSSTGVPSSDDIDSLAAQLAAATTSTGAEEDGDTVAFEGLFEKITQMKASLHAKRPDGTQLTDAERRGKAEENLRALLKSMNMEDELNDEEEEEGEQATAANAVAPEVAATE